MLINESKEEAIKGDVDQRNKPIEMVITRQITQIYVYADIKHGLTPEHGPYIETVVLESKWDIRLIARDNVTICVHQMIDAK